MKKVLLGIVVIAALGAFSSCKKECTCTTYALGEVVTTTVVDGHKGDCGDMNTFAGSGDMKTGIECK